MIYSGSITIPVSTTAIAPSTTSLKMAAGVIHNIKVTFPPGCVGLAGISFWIGGHPIYPANAGTWFVADGRTIEFDEYLELLALENNVTVKAYNTDTAYEHTIYYEFGVLKDWQVNIHKDLQRLINLLKMFLGKSGIA